MKKTVPKVLVVFNAGAVVYGMERGVIEAFDLLWPEIEPHFLMSFTTRRLDLPILKEIKSRNLSHSFFSDKTDWPRIGRPRSLSEGWQMLKAMVRGNRDVLKAAAGKDMIYLPSVTYAYFSVLALIKQRLLGRKTAYQFHDLLLKPSQRLKLLSPFVTDFIHCSQLGFELVAKGNPFIRKRRNHFLPYRTGSPRSKDHPINVNGDFDNKVNLLFFGQVSRHKGIDILLDAFAKVSAEYPAAYLHLAGGYSDPNFERECNDFISRSQLQSKIKYWGYVEDIEQLLKLADVHVHPSPPSRFMDTFPLAALESMRFGVPIVCFESGGLPGMIAGGGRGILCQET